MIYTQSTHLISSTTPNDYTVPRLSCKVFRSRDEFSRHSDAIIFQQACHARDFTWNRGCSPNSPPLTHGDQIPHPWKTLIIKFPPPPDGKGVKCLGNARGGGCCRYITGMFIMERDFKKAFKTFFFDMSWYSLPAQGKASFCSGAPAREARQRSTMGHKIW